MTFDEMDDLDRVDPSWALLTNDEFRARFWMYDIHMVRAARAEAHRRLLVAAMAPPFLRFVEWLSNALRGKGAADGMR